MPAARVLRYTSLTALAGTLGMPAAGAVADLTGLQHLPSAADLAVAGPQVAYAVLVATVLAVPAWATGVRRLGAAGAALTIAALVAANLTTRTAAAPAPVPAAPEPAAVTDRLAVVDPAAVVAR